MKVVILAGGFGTRLSEYTEKIPKPMVTIGGKPILWHIMNEYSFFGHKDFYIALGYKSELIKEFFLNYHALNSNFTVNLQDGRIKHHQESHNDWTVSLVDTGLKSMTGGRVKRLQPYIGNETFLLTYGDGVSDIDINQLISFHHDKARIMTVSGVRPPSRFGELNYDQNSIITEFNEKPQATEGRISGGFFVCQREIFNYLDSEREDQILETTPMQNIASDKQMVMYPHDGFWQCMDTYRDYKLLNELYENKTAPWMVWD